MEINDIDGGIEYSENGKTLSFSGEQEQGEVHLNGVFYGYYELGYELGTDTIYIKSAEGVELAKFVFDEDSYLEFADKMFK